MIRSEDNVEVECFGDVAMQTCPGRRQESHTEHSGRQRAGSECSESEGIRQLVLDAVAARAYWTRSRITSSAAPAEAGIRRISTRNPNAWRRIADSKGARRAQVVAIRIRRR